MSAIYPHRGRVCLFNSYLPRSHQKRGPAFSFVSKPTISVHFNVEIIHTKRILRRCASASKPVNGQAPTRRKILDVLVDVDPIELWDILTDRNLTFFHELHLVLQSEDFKAVRSEERQLGTTKVVGIQLSYTTPLPLARLRANNTEQIQARWENQESQGWSMQSTASTSNVPFSSLFVNRIYWEVKSCDPGKARLSIASETVFFGPVLAVMQRTLEAESFKGIKEAYKVLPSVIKQIIMLKKGQNRTFPRNSRHSSRMSVPMKSGDGSISEFVSGVCVPESGLNFDEIVHRVGIQYPSWTSKGYLKTKINKVEVPTPKDAIEILKAVTEARHTVFQWQSLLPRHPLVRGLLDCLQLDQGSASCNLPLNLVPDAMRCLGIVGRDYYFESEMGALCSVVPLIEFNSTKQVHSAIRGLCLSRHWTPHLTQLECSIIRIISDNEFQTVTPQSFRYAAHCCQGLVYLAHTPLELFDVLEAMYDTQRIFSWEASISLAWSLAMDRSETIHHALVERVLEGMARNAENWPDYMNARLGMLGQFFLTLQLLRPGLLESYYAEENKRLSELVLKAIQSYTSTSTRHISAAQKEVYDCFLRMGYKARLESTVNGISLDIILQEPVQIAVEVNGVTHFARNSEDLLIGNAEWKRRMLHAVQWKMLAINVNDWNQLRGTEQRTKFLSDALQTIV